MVVRKSQGGNKTPHGAQKPTPKKNVAEQDLELDEDDDEDLEFEDDSELDDEEFDDEGSVDEELDEDMDEGKEEAAPSPKIKQKVTQKTPSKRKAEESTPSPAKRVRLEDYIPASQIMDYEDRDRRTLCLTNFHGSVEYENVKKVCKEALEVRGRRKTPLSTLFVTYQTPGDAQAAVKKLQDVKLQGKPLKVEYCATLQEEGRPSLKNSILNVHNIPDGTTKADFRALFPGSRVPVWRRSSAKVQFKSPADLEKAIRNPQCHKIRDAKLTFAFPFERQPREPKRKTVAKEVPTTPAGKGKKGPKAKTPKKQRSVTKTPSPSKSPKTVKVVGATKSPLSKQQKSPKGAPKGRKSTGKKQIA